MIIIKKRKKIYYRKNFYIVLKYLIDLINKNKNEIINSFKQEKPKKNFGAIL